MEIPESNSDIIELQLQIDELSWGVIRDISHITQYNKIKASDNLSPSWYAELKTPPTVVTNEFIMDYMIENCESVMKDVEINGRDINKVHLVSMISLEDDRHAWFYFNKDKIMTNCEPSESIEKNGIKSDRIRYHEGEATTKLCRLMQPHLRSGKLSWDWFRRRFRIDVDWQ